MASRTSSCACTWSSKQSAVSSRRRVPARNAERRLGVTAEGEDAAVLAENDHVRRAVAATGRAVSRRGSCGAREPTRWAATCRRTGAPACPRCRRARGGRRCRARDTASACRKAKRLTTPTASAPPPSSSTVSVWLESSPAPGGGEPVPGEVDAQPADQERQAGVVRRHDAALAAPEHEGELVADHVGGAELHRFDRDHESSGGRQAPSLQARYGRGTSPTRSRTLASVRPAMASARSAPVLRTSSV